MRLHEAINAADRMRPNSVGEPDKISAIYRLERDFAEMMEVDPPEWDLDEEDPELLIAAPHDQVYPVYLLPFIDIMQEEIDKYQADSVASNQMLAEVKSAYRRGHRFTKNTQLKGVFI